MYTFGKQYTSRKFAGLRTYKGTFDPKDLLFINIYEPKSFDEKSHGESWANYLCRLVYDPLYAVDMESTTGGNTRGINVLIHQRNLTKWQSTVDEIGATLDRSNLPVRQGHYGDANWEGVELVSDGHGQLRWFE